MYQFQHEGDTPTIEEVRAYDMKWANAACRPLARMTQAVARLREEYRQAESQHCRRAHCSDCDRRVAQAQNQLKWLVPLHRAVRAYMSNLYAVHRFTTLGYDLYVTRFNALAEQLAKDMLYSGHLATLTKYGASVLDLQLLEPAPESSGQYLMPGPTVLEFAEAVYSRMEANRKVYLDTRSAFLASLTAAQVELLKATMAQGEALSWACRDTVTFKGKELRGLRPQP